MASNVESKTSSYTNTYRRFYHQLPFCIPKGINVKPSVRNANGRVHVTTEVRPSASIKIVALENKHAVEISLFPAPPAGRPTAVPPCARLNLGIGEKLGKGCLHRGIVTCSHLVMQFFGSCVCCNSFCTTFQADQGTPLERAIVKVQTRCSLASLGSLDDMMFCISDVNDSNLKKHILRL